MNNVKDVNARWLIRHEGTQGSKAGNALRHVRTEGKKPRRRIRCEGTYSTKAPEAHKARKHVRHQGT